MISYCQSANTNKSGFKDKTFSIENVLTLTSPTSAILFNSGKTLI